MGKSSNSNGEKPLRIDKAGYPMLVITSNLKRFCHEKVDSQTDEGDVITVKMRPTGPFLDKFNTAVFQLLNDSIQAAQTKGRTNMLPEDIPELVESTDE